THRKWVERRQRVEVRAPRRVERPHEALRHIDKEGETGERAHGGALPGALQPERQRECKERHESEQRNREVRPERAEPRRNDRRQLGGARRRDREEVLVPRQEQRAREKVGRSTEGDDRDRKSTRLNSSHVAISYAVFCLKKKIQTQT